MANVLKKEWFGKPVKIALLNGKTISGDVTQVSDSYIVLSRGGIQVQVMAHAIAIVTMASESEAAAE